jgi:hypothetical protein
MSKGECTRCKGTGKLVSDGSPPYAVCDYCQGTGEMTFIDLPDQHPRQIAGHNPPPPQGAERPPAPPAPPNLTALKFDPSKIAAAADWIERNMGDMIRYHVSYARLQRERYVALVSVGFTPEQALELLKSPMF